MCIWFNRFLSCDSFVIWSAQKLRLMIYRFLNFPPQIFKCFDITNEQIFESFENKKKIGSRRIGRSTLQFFPLLCFSRPNWIGWRNRKRRRYQFHFLPTLSLSLYRSSRFWKMICQRLFKFLEIVCRRKQKSSKTKTKKKWIQNFNHQFVFSFSYSLRDNVAISQFAHHQQPIRCRALGGIRNVVTRVYWSERINMDAKVIVKCEPIHRCVI